MCLDSSQCYSQPLAQRAWVLCSRCLGVLLRPLLTQKEMRLRGNLPVTLRWQTQMLSCRKPCLEKRIEKPRFLLALLVGLSLLSGCSTFSLSQPSVQSGQQSHLSPLPPLKIKRPSASSGDSPDSQVEQTSPQQSQQGTSLWSASPLWRQ